PGIERISDAGEEQKGAVGTDRQPIHFAGGIAGRDYVHPIHEGAEVVTARRIRWVMTSAAMARGAKATALGRWSGRRPPATSRTCAPSRQIPAFLLHLRRSSLRSRNA